LPREAFREPRGVVADTREEARCEQDRQWVLAVRVRRVQDSFPDFPRRS